jgi:hypothetical protein
MKITCYNTFGTKESRIVISYEDNSENAANEARYRAAQWNKNETREDMRIYFILMGNKLTTA